MRCDCDICKMGRKINDLINDLINRYGLSEKDKDLLLDTLPPCLEYVDIRTVNFFELEAKDKRIEELQAKCDRLEEALESLQELLDNDNFMEHNLDVSAKVIISQALNGE